VPDTKLSALTAASTLDGTETYPADQSSVTKKVTGNQIQTMVRRAGSATAGSWPIFGSGTVLTSPVAGAEEYDGTVEYFSPAASSRAVRLNEYFICLSSTYTLVSQTGAQALFGGSGTGPPTPNGRLTLPVASYFFDMLLSLSSMSATSGNAKIDILGAGTATVGTVLYYAAGVDGAVNTAAANQGNMSNAVGSTASIVTAGTGTALQVSLRGSFRVTGVGYITPSISLVTAAAAVLAAGSYFRCRPMGSSTVTTCGNWS